MASLTGTKVLIRNSNGMYVGGDEHGLRLVNGVYGALLFEPEQEQVTRLLLELRKEGLLLEVIPFKPEEVFETCDQCGTMVTPLMVFFDGQRFLCADCRKQSER